MTERFIGWSYDIAREQSPDEQSLKALVDRSAAAGYNALGLYLEHRFAWRAAPWVVTPGCLTPDVMGRVIEHARGRGVRVIPFLNTLGHMEGFLRAEGGQALAETPRGAQLQLCPSRHECAEFVRHLVDDALAAFDDPWVHLGGDEATQLGACGTCAVRVEREGAAAVYGQWMGTLCTQVVKRGRRPCLWADMALTHPKALAFIPRQTVFFDWHYYSSPAESTRRLREWGYEVVCCPSVQTYNATWCHLGATEQNIDVHAGVATGASGVLVTTWELCWFSEIFSVLPVVMAAGRHLARGTPWREALIAEGGRCWNDAADILGRQIPGVARFLRPPGHRQLRDRLVCRLNPFLLWEDWRDEACHDVGDRILQLCGEAEKDLAADHPMRFPITLHRVGVEWVRRVEGVARLYRGGDPARAAAELAGGVVLLETLRPWLGRVAAAGGSAVDAARLDALVGKVREVCRRLEALPARGGRPAFEVLCHDAWVPGDQAAWRTGEYR
jgi:hypothetical protein